MPLLRAALLVSFTSTAVFAQQNVGIYVFHVPVSASTVLCGFDCSARDNTGQTQLRPLDIFGVRMIGEANRPAAVFFGIGPAETRCPGLALPGFGNSLQINLGGLITGPVTAALSGPNRSCGGTANAPLLQNLVVPVNATGMTLTVQGLVHDGGMPAFTRPIEIHVTM